MSIDLTFQNSISSNGLKKDLKELAKSFPHLHHTYINGVLRVFGNYNLMSSDQKILGVYSIEIIYKSYPHSSPIFIERSHEIPRSEDFHINEQGVICYEYDTVRKFIEKKGFGVHQFVKHYVRRYLVWTYLKSNTKFKLCEWEHGDKAAHQFYSLLFMTNNFQQIITCLLNFLKIDRIKRNSLCYCNSNKKVKKCHLSQYSILNNLGKDYVRSDILKLLKYHSLNSDKINVGIFTL